MMRTRICTIAAITLAAFMPTALAAQDSERVEFERVKDRDEVTLDPDKTYLLVESPTLAMPSFIVMPNDEQREDWARQRAEEMAEAVEDYPDDMRRYERDMETWQATGRRASRRPQMPIEPTEESFPWPDLESRRIASTGPLNRFYKSDDVSLWLSEVPPGDYVFYGFGFGPTAVGAGTCMCMGSVDFVVEPGKITALRVGSLFLDADGNRQAEVPDDSNTTDLMTRQVMLIGPATGAAYDPRIPRDRIVAAEFSAVENLPNWFGGMVARVEPIEGVLGYDRDKAIDLRAASEPEPVAEMPVEAEPAVDVEDAPAPESAPETGSDSGLDSGREPGLEPQPEPTPDP